MNTPPIYETFFNMKHSTNKKDGNTDKNKDNKNNKKSEPEKTSTTTQTRSMTRGQKRTRSEKSVSKKKEVQESPSFSSADPANDSSDDSDFELTESHCRSDSESESDSGTSSEDLDGLLDDAHEFIFDNKKSSKNTKYKGQMSESDSDEELSGKPVKKRRFTSSRHVQEMNNEDSKIENVDPLLVNKIREKNGKRYKEAMEDVSEPDTAENEVQLITTRIPRNIAKPSQDISASDIDLNEEEAEDLINEFMQKIAEELGEQVYEAVKKRADEDGMIFEEEDEEEENFNDAGPIIIIGKQVSNKDDSSGKFSRDRKRKKDKEDDCCSGKKSRVIQTDETKNKLRSYKDNLTAEEKEWLAKEERAVYEIGRQQIPPRDRILKSPMSRKSKLKILTSMDRLATMNSFSSEYGKLVHWVEGVMNIPFGKNVDLPVNISSDNQKIQDYLSNVHEQMNDCIYGQQNAKQAILECVGRWISNPTSTNSPIAFVGEKGTGKTTLAKEGIAKALGRPFYMISLGGESDASSFKGHDYTYEGSRWGRIAEVLMHTQCMNPVIFFDELDKLSETKAGEEIAGMLIHLTDTTQNSSFSDKYFAGIDLDLSQALFIFSYNYPHKVHPILRDRITEIQFDRFSVLDKVRIAKKFLFPRICSNIGLRPEKFEISETTLEELIRRYAPGEDGVREMKKMLETLFLRLNLAQLPQKLDIPYKIKPQKDVFTITLPIATQLLKGYQAEEGLSVSAQMMYL